MARRRLTGVMAGVAVAVIVVDQLTKWWAARTLANRDIDLVWTLRFHLERNRGAAFSLVPGRGGLVAIIAIVIVVVLVVVGRAVDSRTGAVALGLVLGGAIGNLVDRAVREGNGFLGGAVIDFIDLQWWPVFNVADMGVTIGGLLLVLVATKPAS